MNVIHPYDRSTQGEGPFRHCCRMLSGRVLVTIVSKAPGSPPTGLKGSLAAFVVANSYCLVYVGQKNLSVANLS